jgi:alpha-L-fucosidase
MTMNDTWGYKKNDHNWKSTEVLVRNLVDVAAKGGNYLLNVGPTAEGLIPEPSVERLQQIGKWMDINGEAIYATEKLQHNYKQDENIRYTRQKEAPGHGSPPAVATAGHSAVYYGILLETPDNTVNFKYLKPKEGAEIHLLGHDTPLEWNFDEEQRLTINIPDEVTQNESLKYAWVFRVEGEEIL